MLQSQQEIQNQDNAIVNPHYYPMTVANADHKTIGTYSTLTATPSSKKVLHMENYKKVQRRKLEKLFISEMKSNYSIDHLEELKHRMENEPPKALPPLRTQPEKFRTIMQRPPDTIQAVNEFHGSIQCLELTQGGATLWTAEQDGSIAVRSGVTGQIVHTIPRHAQLSVSSLYATDNHMWVGFNDGTVRVFDHLVYLCIHEAKFHTDAVTCFTITFDAKVFSGAADTTIVKWDHERRSFELMTKILAGHTKAVRCLVSYGYHLFSAGDDPVIRCADTETGQKVQLYEGHTAAITNLLVLDGFLFSSSLDHSVRVWNIDSGECLKKLREAGPSSFPVTCLVADSVGHRIWAADTNGMVNIWESDPEVDFKHIQTVPAHPGTSILGMKNFCAIDATKVWSLASNGINKVWYSSLNKVEDAMQETITAMQDILNEDVIELDKWNELIQRMRTVDQRRKHELGEALARSTDKSLLRWYFLKFLRCVHVFRIASRKTVLTSILASSCASTLRQRYFLLLWNYSKERRYIFLKNSMTRNLLQTTEKNLISTYWKRMNEFRDRFKVREQRNKMIECLFASTSRGLLHTYFRHWIQLSELPALASKRQRLVEAFLRNTSSGVQRISFFKLMRYVRVKGEIRKKNVCAEALATFSTTATRSLIFSKWRNFIRQRHITQKRRLIAETFARSIDSRFRSMYLSKWQIYVKESKRHTVLQKVEESRTKYTQLREKYKEVEHLVEKQKEINDIQTKIDEQISVRNRQSELITSLRAEQTELRAKIEDDRRNQSIIQKNMSEKLDDVMAKLKAKVLNFHFDYSLISQLKGQQDKISRVFLEAHIRVKRVVVDLTKLSNPPRRWPLTEEMLHKMPLYQLKVVLRAIKEMIIAFDMMDETVRNSLESDEEIVENADILLAMADVCVKYIRDTMGRIPAR